MYWWPYYPNRHTFSVFTVGRAYDATWSPDPPGAFWRTSEPGIHLNTNTHYQVPDLFTILHGIGPYNGD